jgi:hypothetical protein
MENKGEKTMKTNIKIYDGVTIDMSTSQVIETGKVSYVNASEVSYTKGGGNKGSATTTTGFDPKHSAAITSMLGDGKSMYDSGQLGKVAGFNKNQLAGQAGGIKAAGVQTGLEAALAAQANKGVDLSGMRTGAKNDALSALGMNAAGASRAGGLGGSRQAINSQSVANDLAAKFGQIDQSAQAQNFANKQAALGVQGTGAQTLAGIGAGQQQQSQNEADAAYKGLSQYASLFHGVADKSTTTTQNKGGGK